MDVWGAGECFSLTLLQLLFAPTRIDRNYSGCIQFELTALYPLFPGSDEPDQIDRIHRVLGNPKARTLLKLKRHASSSVNFDFPRQEGIGLPKLLPDADDRYIDLLSRAVAYDTVDRITSRQAVDHPFFDTGRKAQGTIKGQNGRMRGHRQIRGSLLSTTNKAKVAPAPAVTSSSSSLSTNDAKQVDEASKAGGPDRSAQNAETSATKPRSMVSIMLARSSQNQFATESKSRNKTIYRRGKIPPREAKPRGGGGAGPHDENTTTHTTQSTRRRRRAANKKFAHVRSSGYGGTASTEPTSSGGSDAPLGKLPPLPPLKEDLKQKHSKKRNGKGGRTKRLPPISSY